MKINGYNISVRGKTILNISNVGKPKLNEKLQHELHKRIILLLYKLDEFNIEEINIKKCRLK
jgi:hypothetical protein